MDADGEGVEEVVAGIEDDFCWRSFVAEGLC